MKMKTTFTPTFFFIIIIFSNFLKFEQILANPNHSTPSDFSKAIIICPKKSDKVSMKAITVFIEEVEKRTGIKLKIKNQWPDAKMPVIAIGEKSLMAHFIGPFADSLRKYEEIGPEGFYLVSKNNPRPAILVVGNDARGVLYGIGRLLRKLELRPNQIILPVKLEIATTPRYPIRGHQLGYRPKTNTYDAWTIQQYDQYIRELALFGANSIEIMPPRTDDDPTSSHLKVPPMKMMIEHSRIIDSYGLDVWIWYPNMGTNYTHPDSIRQELNEREEIFRQLTRIYAVFVPGGDPGDLHPDVLFTWLEKMAVVLQKYHPQAKIWISPQAFRPTKDWLDVFYSHVNKEYPWFGGVVFGPWVKTPLPEIRKIVNASIPIRRYPDITHSLSCQYPVPHWDLAFAMTLGRECTNPRPEDEKTIHNAFDEFANGSLSYSEGINDDVNKFIWSDQDWDPETPVIETLRDYCRLFMGPDYTESLAPGIMAQEQNWRGPLLTNSQVEITFQQWQNLEKTAPNKILSNYRFQMCLIRAYYDAYIQRRLIYETEIQRQVMAVLSQASESGALTAISQARAILIRSRENTPAPALRKRCFDLADSLYKNIGAQLTVKKHGAQSGRGNYLDNIDLPLNDALWFLSQFEVIHKLESEKERLAAIQQIIERINPGPGGFYDNFGDPRSWERVQQPVEWAKDPGSLLSPRVSFGVGLRGEEWIHEVRATGFEGRATPLAWMHQVNTLYDEPLVITYKNLDPSAAYRLKVAYTGRFRSKMKLIANQNYLIHDLIQTGVQPIYEFDIPAEVIKNGILKLSWTCGEGERGAQVAEIWLIKK